MDSGDEAFNEYIEVSDSEVFEEPDSDKENLEQSEGVTCVAKSKPTKRAQIEKIIAFVKENNEQLIEKSVYDSLWSYLTEDLNRLSPPEYTSDKWKRVWSQYKYRNKIRLSELFGSTRQNEPSNSDPERQKLSPLSPDQLPIQAENSMSSQMTTILEQQNIILSTIVELGVILKRSVELLEELSKKMK